MCLFCSILFFLGSLFKWMAMEIATIIYVIYLKLTFDESRDYYLSGEHTSIDLHKKVYQNRRVRESML